MGDKDDGHGGVMKWETKMMVTGSHEVGDKDDGHGES